MTFEDEKREKPWQNISIWKRGLGMLFYGFVSGFVRVLITFIAIFQFVVVLFNDKPNKLLLAFGQSLNTYLYQINQFLTMNTDDMPFPLADWPDGEPKRKSYIDMETM